MKDIIIGFLERRLLNSRMKKLKRNGKRLESLCNDYSITLAWHQELLKRATETYEVVKRREEQRK
jgi:hypothetical protein